MGPQTEAGEKIHSYKYRLPGETYRDSINRIASALKDDDKHFHQLQDVLGDMRFLPGGRIQAGAGSGKNVTMFNCYVSGTIDDSFTHGSGRSDFENMTREELIHAIRYGKDSITGRVDQAADTMRMGGGIGYDFSTLRPSGDLIRGVRSTTDGPLAFLPIFDAVCKATSSSGNRRGAQMGVLRVDHPDIREYVAVKHDLSKLTGFNLSIAVTDEFMHAVEAGKDFTLQFGGKSYGDVYAPELWEMVMRSTWDYAEPGVLFIDTINRMNPLNYCETIAATNPCGEQPLPPFGACLLGSFNLVKYASPIRSGNSVGTFDYAQLTKDIAPVVRAMDNVVDASRYPLPQQRDEAFAKRRMGIGITGFANASEIMGMPYGEAKSLGFLDRVLRAIRDEAYKAGTELAREKGSFPAFDAEKYLATPYAQTLDDGIRWRIRRHGLRNSHYTSIAPTGTISFAADYVSSSIEPVHEYEERRVVNMPSGPEIMTVTDYAYRVYGVQGKLAEDVTAKQHVDVLTTASRIVDSAVSKTCNVSPDMPWDDFKAVYTDAWKGGAKGCTTFNPGGKRMGILLGNSSGENDAGMSCDFDPETGKRSCE